MQVGSEQWRALLMQGAAQMGLTIDPEQAGQMAIHALALLEWNRTINLTAITDPLEIAVKHFLDAIAPMPYIPSSGPLLDLGTGGGFPGIPLKIMRPEQPMVLVDGVRKKITFVKQVLRRLAAPNITAVQTRAEAMARQAAYQGRFDIIVCRALADLDTITRITEPLLSSQGSVYVYQGPGDEGHRSADTTQGRISYRRIVSHDYALPILGDPRTLSIIAPHTRTRPPA